MEGRRDVNIEMRGRLKGKLGHRSGSEWKNPFTVCQINPRMLEVKAYDEIFPAGSAGMSSRLN